jgi:hypothetical protein
MSSAQYGALCTRRSEEYRGSLLKSPETHILCRPSLVVTPKTSSVSAELVS